MNKFFIYTTLFVGIITNQAYAACDGNTLGYYPSKLPDDYYGNGQTDRFRCAIEGKTQLSAQEQAELEALIPQSHDNRFYVRFGLNSGTEKISGVKNNGTDISSALVGIPTNVSEKTSSNEIEMAIGYSWKDFAVDLEWMSLRKIRYSGAFVATSSTPTITSEISGDAYLLNAHYNIKDFYNFKIYLTGIFGTTKTEAETRVNSSSPTISSRWGLSFGGGIGAKFNLVSQLYADMTVRGLLLNTKVKMEDADTTSYIILKGTRSWIGASARFIWLF